MGAVSSRTQPRSATPALRCSIPLLLVPGKRLQLATGAPRIA